MELAGQISASLNRDVDPCDDFHTFACGGWESSHVIPDDKSSYSMFTVLRDKNQIKLRDLLEETAEGDVAADFYSACMDTESIERIGATPLIDRYDQLKFRDDSGHGIGTNGESWNEDSWEDLTSMLSYLSSLSVEPFMGIGVGADDLDSTRNVLWLSQSGLTLPSRDYYVDKDVNDDSTLVFLVSHIAEFLQLAFASVPNDAPLNATDVAYRIVSLEKTLATNFKTNTELRDPSSYYNPMNVTTVEQLSPSVGWRAFLMPFLQSGYEYDRRESDTSTPVTPQDIDTLLSSTLGEDEKIIVETPEYIARLGDLIEAQSRSTVVWYLRWHFLNSLANHLSSTFRDKSFEFVKFVYGVETQEARWKTCVSRTDYYRGFALGKLFSAKHFPSSSRQSASEMIRDVRTVTKENFKTRSWMDETAQNAAIAKADAVVDKIGFPDAYNDADGVDTFYAGWPDVDLSASDGVYFATVVNGRVWGNSRGASDLRHPVDEKRWGMTAPTVNAYYSPSKNQMVFPAGILQPPFFSEHFVSAWNYGAMGVVMGHELTHGFDDQGSQFDANGNFAPWWSDNVRAEFDEKTNCVKSQYSAYTVSTSEGSMNVDGNLTIGENIADNGGLKQAFAAWTMRFGDTSSTSRPALPGLDFTPDQLFFVAFSQVWCSLYRDDAMLAKLRTDVHSPGRYRIIGTLSNSNDFARSFECPSGSTMNPEEKCEVW